MALDAVKVTRVFKFNTLKLPDPNPNLPLDSVQALLAYHDPEIATATIEGPVLIRGEEVYTFRAVKGPKG